MESGYDSVSIYRMKTEKIKFYIQQHDTLLIHGYLTKSNLI